MLRWTSEIVDATPRYCVRCENPVKSIILTRFPWEEVYFIRCGACGFILLKVPMDTPTILENNAHQY